MRQSGKNEYQTIDGNQAAAWVAYHTNEVVAIYPITPSSPMGEWADEWANARETNLWGSIPFVQEMQSEGGAAGAVHGALQAGSLTTTFTSSQGLLLMIPNMYKIAGELTPTVFHVAARSLAAQALSIFCDHSDVMATRSTGFAMLASNSVQEVMDFALIAQAATLSSRIPFLHFFDGFRTSHEISKIRTLHREQLRSMIDDELVWRHRQRSLSPDQPVIRGTAQNPDVYFQARETVNRYYEACPGVVQDAMNRFARLTGRQYRLFEYFGAPDADRVLVLMGSGAETAQETAAHLMDQGEKVGVLKVRLYRPFSGNLFVQALPDSVRSLAVLDRTKEPGSPGEPLYLDVVSAVTEFENQARFERTPRIIGGRYGLSSKEFTPAMVEGVFQELNRQRPRNHFTVGIADDVSHTSLPFDPSFSTVKGDVVRALFYGLGSDGTVSANKNSIKIIGEQTENYAQGYFVYDSKKAGSVTVSHLRFGPRPIHSSYLISRAGFVACHQFAFLERIDVLKALQSGGTFLLNSPYDAEETWHHLPLEVQQKLMEQKARFYVIDAYRLAREIGLGARINTIMQTVFFALIDTLPTERAVEAIKESIQETYGKSGELVVRKNFEAVDRALESFFPVTVPDKADSPIRLQAPVPDSAPDFVRDVVGPIMAGSGDDLPVSRLPVDGTFPVGTARWEKRNIALEIPVWDPQICIQCNKCVLVCPHAVIRAKVFDPELLNGAPADFKSTSARTKEWAGLNYSLQVAPEDCTGCGLCVEVCPVRNKSEVRLKAINMRPQEPLRRSESENWNFFLELPEMDRSRINLSLVPQCQVLQPLFEFSGACAGCGETPYIKLMTQLFGDRTVVANATGCSSIYGGNLPTTPWSSNSEGRGPAWSNSLFEDNAEFGLGMRLALNQQEVHAREILAALAAQLDAALVRDILEAEQFDEAGIYQQRRRVTRLKEQLQKLDSPQAVELLNLADKLVRKNVWIIGGDGWAYDIGFGGLDHLLASDFDVNVLVLDTEVYSNTGGQMSKATPLSAVAKFAAGGKPRPKKDLGLMAMLYGHVYVASVAMGAKDAQTVKAFLEAESYPGPSLIIAYSHCIAHGINMSTAMENQKAAVLSGYWPLYRYDPRLAVQGKNPLQLDSGAPKTALENFTYRENRFKILTRTDPDRAAKLLKKAQQQINQRWKLYQYLSAIPPADVEDSRQVAMAADK